MKALDYAIEVVSSQTAGIKKRLKKNRTRCVYLVQNDDGINRLFYDLWDSIVFASKYGAWIYCGRQKYNWIVCGNLSGIHYNKKKVYFMPKTNNLT